jgi:protein TonB
MFSQLEAGPSRRFATILSASLLFHVVVFIWMLRAPAPAFLAPSLIVRGEHGTEITRIYWEGASSDKFQQDAQQTHLTLPRQRVRKQESKTKRPSQSLENEVAASREPEPGRPAGSPYGSLSEGTLSGSEVRPALPLATLDPMIAADELPPGFEGNIVIEVTIDEQGNVMETLVEQSISALVDAKVLAAVRSWRFRPATRNGVAIASKQDVYYHFPHR